MCKTTQSQVIQMRKTKLQILFFIFIACALNCVGQRAIVPAGFEILEEALGDLDKDGVAERVVVYNTTDTTEDGILRELQVLKLINNEWVAWKKSRTAVLKSGEGGMMGNPFEGIEITKGVLVISFSGGSSWKWFYKDKYRFQHNKFELIGYSGVYGKLCEYWVQVDFNLSNGKIIYKKEFEDCEKDQAIYKRQNEVFYKKGIRLHLGNRNTDDVKIISPKYKHELIL